MSLEACMICIDNSEFMRNGDFLPSRFDAQHEAVNLIAGAKTQQHSENSVGVVAMASTGKSTEVLVNLTSDFGQILTSVHKAKIGGQLHFSVAINVARLALKHRQNKNQRQRIIVFVASPLQEDAKDLVNLGKKLKKNNVSLDIVNFGQEAENATKLEGLVNAVDKDNTSHLITVPPGPHILSDILVSSPIVRGEGGDDAGQGGVAAGGAAGGAGGAGFEFGVDPTLDPELAMALRLSLEEHEREQQRLAAAQGSTGSTDNTNPPASTSAVTTANPSADAAMDTDIDEEMRLAIEMSLAESSNAAGSEAAGTTPAQDTTAAATSDNTTTDLLSDPDYINSILMSLPGVDPSDPSIQRAMQNLAKDGDVEMSNPDDSANKEPKKDNTDNNSQNPQ
eukprot:c5867_g1_i1.p1 GENE.c5867_g1_i1~~c5867_g1_i1.p1  ORF type:complete len:413 (+),score=153.96 c5867_g1_i1:58-1239(+)